MRFRKRDADRELEARLRAARPEPPPDVTRAIADRVRPRRGGFAIGFRTAPLRLAGGLTAFILTAAIAFGGWSAPVDAATTVLGISIGGNSPSRVVAAPTANQYDNRVTVCVLLRIELRLPPLAARLLVAIGLGRLGPCGGGTPSADRDGDGVPNRVDNCPNEPNRNQRDRDNDGIGNACDPVNNNRDRDGDGVRNARDNCPDTPNRNQRDRDNDGIGNACDPVNNNRRGR